MKLQFYFDRIERDLLRCALERWETAIVNERNANFDKPKTGHMRAGHFTERRINEMLARLKEPDAPNPLTA